MAEGRRKRMRSRFSRFGAGQMLDHELLEMLLYFCNKRQDTNPIAHALLDRFDSLFGVFTASEKELQEVEGIGPSAAFFLRLTGEMIRRTELDRVERKPMRSVGELCDYCCSLLAGEKTEQFYALFFDVRFNLISTKHMASGLPDQVAVYPRLIAEAALNSGAANVVLTHNHPAGSSRPSPDDIRTTERVKAALSVLDINFVEHIIVTDEDAYAMNAGSRIENRKPMENTAQSSGLLDPGKVAEYLKTLGPSDVEDIIKIIQDDG